MANWLLRSSNIRRAVRVFRSGIAAALLCAAGGLVLVSGAEKARADGIYIGGPGFAVGVGSRGYRGSFYWGRAGYYGPPYRPYGAPYYYHPYDMRAYPYRSRVYVAPPRYRAPARRYYGQPQRVPYTKTGLAPFTPAWVRYCSRKYKSFNPNTGTYLAYSGKYRFCR
ncbi:BA14K family protein [Roseibium aggregatum]|uniref:Lectin-like protein BA14k n=1 Tax=Roseibium aggregatum TaxID=187304 RepID=A0A939J0R0_9HYPH|nr:BA14K family protein [Roseibium aggregatum]MBN9669553.1 BA14K family protein [Roseibium aggregatum]